MSWAVGRALALAGLLAAVALPGAARPVTDATGRTVELPDRIERVFPAGPPASVIVYMIAPDKLLGWTRALGAPERPFVPARYAELPEIGRLTGRGNTVNLEVVVGLKPDLILDVGSTSPTYVSLAARVQEQTHVPTLLIGGRLADTAKTFREIGALLGAADAAEPLARYAEETLGEVKRRTDAVPAAQRPKIYFARGPRGLETAVQGSINVEALDVVAATNVAAESLGAGGLVNVSLEQVLAWQPDVIVTVDRQFYAGIYDDPEWRGVKAVRDHRVYLSPGLPFGWIDAPPAANRLIGLRWLGKMLYPALFPEDLRAETRKFYTLFYHQAPSDAQLDALLAGTPG
jgi:iron complex transport system substrate-binding protein